MEIIHAVVLGIVQGLTEFLPISSSGHLIVLPYIFNWDLQNLSFDVGLHFGTTLAVLIYFSKEWKNLISSAFIDTLRFVKIRDVNTLRHQSRVFYYIFISIIPVGVIGLLFENDIEKNLRSPLLVSFTLILIAFVMYFAQNKKNKLSQYAELDFKKIFLISISQILALIPGVSRSGITISTGLFLNLSKYDAAKISFLLATPIILGATLSKLKDFTALTGNDLSVFIMGVVVSFIVGLACIKWFLNFLKTHSLMPFIIYRILLGVIIIFLYII